jgi:Ca2+-binding EF-hand superfamily protein
MPPLSKKQLNEIEKVFSLYEGPTLGRLSFANFPKAVRSLGIALSDPQLNKIVENLRGQGQIDFDLPEFVSLVSTWYKDLNLEEELRECFKLFDYEGTGRVSINFMKHVFGNMGERFSQRDFETLLSEYGFSDQEAINFEEFLKLMA